MSLLSEYDSKYNSNPPIIIPPIPVPPPPAGSAPSPELPEIQAAPENLQVPQNLESGTSQELRVPQPDPPPPVSQIRAPFEGMLYETTTPGVPDFDLPAATAPSRPLDNYVSPFFGQSDPSQLLQRAFKPQVESGGNFNPFQWKFGDMGEGPLGALFYLLNLPFSSAAGLGADAGRQFASISSGRDQATGNFGNRLRESGGNLLTLGRNVISDFGAGYTATETATRDKSGQSFFTQALGGRAYSFSDDEYNKKGQLNPYGYVTSRLVGIPEDSPMFLAEKLPETALSKKARDTQIFNQLGSVIGVPLQGFLNIPGLTGTEPIKLPKLSDWVADRYKQIELTPQIYLKRTIGLGLDAITGNLIEGLPKKLSNQYYRSKQGVVSPELGILVQPEPLQLPGRPDPRSLPGNPPPGQSLLPGQPGLPGTRTLITPPGGSAPNPPGGRVIITPAPTDIVITPVERLVITPPVIELNGVPGGVVELRTALENLQEAVRITPETVAPSEFTSRTIPVETGFNTNVSVTYNPNQLRAVFNISDVNTFSETIQAITAGLYPERSNFLNDLDFENASIVEEFIIPNATRFGDYLENAGWQRMGETNNYARYFDPNNEFFREFAERVLYDLEDARLGLRREQDEFVNLFEDLTSEPSSPSPAYLAGIEAARIREAEYQRYLDNPPDPIRTVTSSGKYSLINDQRGSYSVNRMPEDRPIMSFNENSDMGGTGFDVEIFPGSTPRELYNTFKELLQLNELKDKSFKLDRDNYASSVPGQNTRVTSILERLGFDVGWEYGYSRLDNYTTTNLASEILSPRSRGERFNQWRRNNRLSQIARFVDRPMQEFSNLRMQQIYEITRQIERSGLQDRPNRFQSSGVESDRVLPVSELNNDLDTLEDIGRGALGDLINSNLIDQNSLQFRQILEGIDRGTYVSLMTSIETIEDILGRRYTYTEAVPSNTLIGQAQYILDETRRFVNDTGGRDIAQFLRQRFPEETAGVYSTALRDIGKELLNGINNNLSTADIQANLRNVLYDYELDLNPRIQQLLNEISQPNVLQYDMAYREVQLSLPQHMRGASQEARQATQNLLNADTQLETALNSANEVSQYLADIERPLEFSGQGAVAENIDLAQRLYLGTREVMAPLRMGDRLTNSLERATSQARRIVENPQELPYDVPELIEYTSETAQVMPIEEFQVLQQQINDLREMLPEEMVDDTILQIYEGLAPSYALLPDGTVLNPEAFLEYGRTNPPDVSTGAQLRAEGFNADPTRQSALDLQAQLVDDMQVRAESALDAIDEALNRQGLAEDALRAQVEAEREQRFSNVEDNPRRLTENTYYDDYREYVNRGDARLTVHRAVQAPSPRLQTIWNSLVEEGLDALGENDVDRFIDSVTRFRDEHREMYNALNEYYEDTASLFLEMNRRQGEWLPSDIFPLLDEICQ